MADENKKRDALEKNDKEEKGSQQALIAARLEPNREWGVSKQYVRTNYDDLGKRARFKEKCFDGKKTASDAYTGKPLHKSSQAAKNKYGQENYTKHSADVDHTEPLSEIHRKYKKNPSLSDSDIKEIANSESNLKITSSKTNRAKGGHTNKDFVENPKLSYDVKKTITQDVKKALIQEGKTAKKEMFVKATKKTAQNIGEEFKQGSIEAAKCAVIMSLTQNSLLVLSGEKDLDEVLIDVSKSTVKAAVMGGVVKVPVSEVASITKDESRKLLQMINKNAGYIASTAIIVGGTVIKYIRGDIDEAQVCKDIISGIAGLGASIVLGEAYIPVVIVMTAMGIINQAYQQLDLQKEKADEVARIADAALCEMEHQRNELRDLISDHFEEWDEQFDKGFDEIISSSFNNNADGMASGLNTILSAFGQSVKFKTEKEFDDFFMDENATFSF